MKFAIKDCLSFKLFTEEGKLIHEIDYACSSYLRVNCENEMYLLDIDHEINDLKLLELINGNNIDKSDFENELGEIEIDFGIDVNPNKYKAVGIFNMRMLEGEDKKVKLIFNNVKFNNNYSDMNEIKFKCDEIFPFRTSFMILPDENGKCFKMKAVM